MVGTVVKQDKRNAFEAANIFVLPSYAEGVPIVILEALGCGRPCVVTNTCRSSFINETNIGWTCDTNLDSVTNALENAISCEYEIWNEMGKRAKNLVASRFTWRIITKQLDELYHWLLNKAEKPKFVFEY
jgi:glycosyltransferase involved in cell wall biosynthesis